MEKNGIIRKSNSSWASRVVLVIKKDGTVRFCTDYRDLNSKLQREDSPLPLTAEAIDRLSSGQGSRDSLFLCVLDLASGFCGGRSLERFMPRWPRRGYRVTACEQPRFRLDQRRKG
eukprot:scaffold17606_cov225-Isochrysis_galbana.AAC.1